MTARRIGFVSTRLAGVDGVSLEARKWAAVAHRLGHEVYYCAGELDADAPHPTLIPALHFRDPEATAIGQMAFGRTEPPPGLVPRLEQAAAYLQTALRRWLDEASLDLLVVENALAIPMHLPLGLALARLIAQTGIPAIGHHHDFYWERERFQVHCIPGVLEDVFPPDLPNLRHVVINSLAQQALRERRGLESVVMPNVLDFDAPPPGGDDYNADLRAALDLRPGDLLILQPTRIVPRKGIELAIELVSRLPLANCKLCLTHPAGDEGWDYLRALQAQAAAVGVDLRYIADRFASQRGRQPDGRKVYSPWDAYHHADLVTYPSLYEGFGNALLEAIYSRRPALVNRYPVYVADIAPLGFDFVEIAGQVTAEAVAQVQHLLTDPARRQQMVEQNYELARQHFSYARLRAGLADLLRRE